MESGSPPDRLGRWPAALGLLAFGWVELIVHGGDDPSVLAILAIAYLATQLVGMSRFGVEKWTDRADPFGVYFSMFSRLSPLTADGGFVAGRRPLSGLTDIRWLPGTVGVLCVAIGITAFTIGLVAFCLLVGGFYRLGVAGMHTEVRDRTTRELATRFAHSLGPDRSRLRGRPLLLTAALPGSGDHLPGLGSAR